MDYNSGYRGFSMSKRAVEAYDRGEKLLSKWTKKEIIALISEIDEKKAALFSKCKLSDLKQAVLTRSSWHHTSKYLNSTDFYVLNEGYIEEVKEEDILELVGLKESRKEPEKNTYKGSIRYLEWSGSRAHPKATEKCLENVSIEERGCFYYVYDDAGNEILKKKMDSNGTSVVNYDELKAREERLLKAREMSSRAAVAFYDEIKDYCTTSYSGHIYKKGRKPSSWDYDHGLENFFIIGEHRIKQEYTSGIMHLETWDGNRWVPEEEEKPC